ncbi:MAG: hypothetical protein IIB08_06065, partial [Bacteroidetes bacterium]|nr:hypothetical protein [Bacteroidota bacterium]
AELKDYLYAKYYFENLTWAYHTNLSIASDAENHSSSPITPRDPPPVSSPVKFSAGELIHKLKEATSMEWVLRNETTATLKLKNEFIDVTVGNEQKSWAVTYWLVDENGDPNNVLIIRRSGIERRTEYSIPGYDHISLIIDEDSTRFSINERTERLTIHVPQEFELLPEDFRAKAGQLARELGLQEILFQAFFRYSKIESIFRYCINNIFN